MPTPEKQITPAAQEYMDLCRHAVSCYPPQDPVLVAAARGDHSRVRELLTNWHRSQGHILPEDTEKNS